MEPTGAAPAGSDQVNGNLEQPVVQGNDGSQDMTAAQAAYD